MIITMGIFVFFYSETIKDPDNESLNGIEIILYWLYTLFTVSLLTTLFFSFLPIFFKRKKNAQPIRFSLTGIGILAVLLAGAYLLGNGDPLSIPGYDGNENTFFWMKLTDMWLYTIYLLIGLVIIILFGGIIWSNIKKNR
jgi:membrane protease YdiL (CAAX protease family)